MESTALLLPKSRLKFNAEDGAIFLDKTIKEFVELAEARIRRKWSYDHLYCQYETDESGTMPHPGMMLLDFPLTDFEPQRLCIKGAAGIGKTTTFAKHLHQLCGIVWFMVPTLKMGSEFRLQCEALGINAIQYFGRGKDNCARYESIKAISKLEPDHRSISQMLCKNGEDECPHYQTCPYIEQIENLSELQIQPDSPTVIILVHNLLTSNCAAPAPDFMVIDESHWQQLTRKDILPRYKLFDLANFLPNESHSYLIIIRAVLDALQTEPQKYLEYLRQNGFTDAESLKPAINYLCKILNESTKNIRPDISDQQITAFVGSLEKYPPVIVKALRMLDWLGRELDVNRDVGHVLRYDEKLNRIEVYSRNDLNYDLIGAIPLLILDASSSKVIYRGIWGKGLEIVDIVMQRNAKIHQVEGRRFSKRSITGIDHFGNPYHPDKAEALRVQLIHFINKQSGKVFVAAPKSILPILKEHLGPNVLTENFANLRGTNDYAGCDTAIIIGREEPAAIDVEAHARSLYALDAQALNLTHEYIERGKAVDTRSRIISFSFKVHPDPRVHEVLHQIRECEIEQAIDRLRLVHCKQPKTVYLLNGLVLNQYIEKLYKWKDLVRGGNRLEIAINEIAGRMLAFPLSASELHRLFPLQWKSRDAVKADLARHGGIKWAETYIKEYIQNDPLIHVQYRRAGQRGKSSAALISDIYGAAYLQRALESIVGPIASFSIMGRN